MNELIHNKGTGVIFSPTDVRDRPYLASSVAPEILPAIYKTDTSMFPVLDQFQIPACVSHTFARLMQIYWYKKTGKIINFSPRFLHAYTSPGMAPSDGRDPRVVAKACVTVGCCTTDLLPNDTQLDEATYQNVPITQAMLDEAKQYAMPPFQFVPIDSYDIRHAIYHNGGVALCFQVGKEWWTAVDGTVTYDPAKINPLRAPQVVISGHEVTGEHWKNIEGLENEWGTGWNEGGYGEYDISNYQPTQVIVFVDPTLDFNPSTPNTQYIFTRDLSFGSVGQDVVQLQQRLGVTPTFPIFGPKTKAAVIAYQIANQIVPAVGYCGAITRASLNK